MLGIGQPPGILEGSILDMVPGGTTHSWTCLAMVEALLFTFTAHVAFAP